MLVSGDAQDARRAFSLYFFFSARMRLTCFVTWSSSLVICCGGGQRGPGSTSRCGVTRRVDREEKAKRGQQKQATGMVSESAIGDWR